LSSITPKALVGSIVAIQIEQILFLVPVSLVKAETKAHSDILGEIYSKLSYDAKVAAGAIFEV